MCHFSDATRCLRSHGSPVGNSLDLSTSLPSTLLSSSAGQSWRMAQLLLSTIGVSGADASMTVETSFCVTEEVKIMKVKTNVKAGGWSKNPWRRG
jgi:hypothetical protein